MVSLGRLSAGTERQGCASASHLGPFCSRHQGPPLQQRTNEQIKHTIYNTIVRVSDGCTCAARSRDPGTKGCAAMQRLHPRSRQMRTRNWSMLYAWPSGTQPSSSTAMSYRTFGFIAAEVRSGAKSNVCWWSSARSTCDTRAVKYINRRQVVWHPLYPAHFPWVLPARRSIVAFEPTHRSHRFTIHSTHSRSHAPLTITPKSRFPCSMSRLLLNICGDRSRYPLQWSSMLSLLCTTFPILHPPSPLAIDHSHCACQPAKRHSKPCSIMVHSARLYG